jgi:serine protease Do
MMGSLKHKLLSYATIFWITNRIKSFNVILLVIICVAALYRPTLAQEHPSQVNLGTAVVRVAKQNIPAVVHIEVTERQEMLNPLLPFENDPFFRYFFNVPRMPRKFKRELKGLGTGMIIDSQGHILTNNHVVGGATEIKVLLADGNRYQAKLVGTDPKTDLAVIQILLKESIQHVAFGDSDKLEVGEWVVAIGHPRGLDQTVTQGIISAKHRRGIMDPSNYQDFLQTDAAINPGNSGGPLLNLRGEVVGVNAAIVSQSGGFEGIGFAIPSNMAIYIARQLIGHGRVERGWLGASVQDLTPELAKSFGLETSKGALIADVTKGGPAEKAGVKRGDVIMSYQGKDILDASALRNEVATNPVGKAVGVTLWRNRKEVQAILRIGNKEDAIKMRISSIKGRLGADVRPITSKETEEYRLKSKQGVAIVWLDPDGPLTLAGFEVNDLILEINGKAVDGLEGFVDQVSGLPVQQRVVLLALDHQSGRTGYVQVRVN